MKMFRTLSLLALLTASVAFVGCAATTENSYDNPSKLEQQQDIQELHGKVLRQNY